MLTVKVAKRLLGRGLLLKADEYETKELEVLAKLHTSLYEELVRVQSMLLNLESKDINGGTDIQ